MFSLGNQMPDTVMMNSCFKTCGGIRFFTLHFFSCNCVALRSQTTAHVPALIREDVDDSKLVTLAGNTRPEAVAENDLGAVADGFSLDHMMLLLKRSPQQEQALVQLIDDLHNRRSPNFHKWLTAGDLGQELRRCGFRYPGRHPLARVAGLCGQRRLPQPIDDRFFG